MSQQDSEELALAQAVMQKQMDVMLETMRKIEAAVAGNIQKLDERVEALSAHIAELKQKKSAQSE